MATMVGVRPVAADPWAAALARALADCLDVLIEPISGAAFVESATHPGTLYAVTAISCTCAGGATGGPCKHRACYLAQLGELPAPAPAPCLWCSGRGVFPNDYHQRYDRCVDCAGTGTRHAPIEVAA
jgi:hypothetical protein